MCIEPPQVSEWYPPMALPPEATPPPTPVVQPQPESHAAQNVASGAWSVGWDVAGYSKGGTKVGMAVDVASMGYGVVAGDPAQAKKGATSVTYDSLTMLPVAGPLLVTVQTGWDAAMTVRRNNGASAEDTPSYSQALYDGIPSWADIMSPLTDPDSWTPTGPAVDPAPAATAPATPAAPSATPAPTSETP